MRCLAPVFLPTLFVMRWLKHWCLSRIASLHYQGLVPVPDRGFLLVSDSGHGIRAFLGRIDFWFPGNGDHANLPIASGTGRTGDVGNIQCAVSWPIVGMRAFPCRSDNDLAFDTSPVGLPTTAIDMNDVGVLCIHVNEDGSVISAGFLLPTVLSVAIAGSLRCEVSMKYYCTLTVSQVLQSPESGHSALLS